MEAEKTELDNWILHYPAINRLESKDEFIIGDKERPTAIVPVYPNNLSESEAAAHLISWAHALLKYAQYEQKYSRCGYISTPSGEKVFAKQAESILIDFRNAAIAKATNKKV